MFNLGASKASSPADVVSQAKAVVTMLPASAHVQEVYKGNDGIFRCSHIVIYYYYYLGAVILLFIIIIII